MGLKVATSQRNGRFRLKAVQAEPGQRVMVHNHVCDKKPHHAEDAATGANGWFAGALCHAGEESACDCFSCSFMPLRIGIARSDAVDA